MQMLKFLNVLNLNIIKHFQVKKKTIQNENYDFRKTYIFF